MLLYHNIEHQCSLLDARSLSAQCIRSGSIDNKVLICLLYYLCSVVGTFFSWYRVLITDAQKPEPSGARSSTSSKYRPTVDVRRSPESLTGVLETDRGRRCWLINIVEQLLLNWSLEIKSSAVLAVRPSTVKRLSHGHDHSRIDRTVRSAIVDHPLNRWPLTVSVLGRGHTVASVAVTGNNCFRGASESVLFLRFYQSKIFISIFRSRTTPFLGDVTVCLSRTIFVLDPPR